jgi:hypothetical protein
MTTKTPTKRKTSKRSGRRFAKLTAFLHEQLNSPDEASRREAATHLTNILIHIEEIEDRRAARSARAKENAPAPQEPLPTDPAALEATIAKLKAQAAGGAQ